MRIMCDGPCERAARTVRDSPPCAAERLTPVITLSGILMGFVLGGSVAIEQAFGVPGLGRAMITAVIERDIIIVQNLVFLYALIFVGVNILVDLSYAWFDPRIHYQ